MGNLIGAGSGASDLSSLTSPFGVNASAALTGANPLAAAQLLTGATGIIKYIRKKKKFEGFSLS